MSYGFAVHSRTRSVSAETIEKFRTVAVANASDNMARLSHAGARLRPLHAGGPMAGPALTVRTRPGDNLMVHKALDMAQPGDVIVVDAAGDLTNALIGELMLAYAESKRVGGIVIHGAVRDLAAIRAGSLPVFAAGVTHRGPYKDGPGEINAPISIEGMVVAPGDLVIGDDDGVLAIPFDATETVYRGVQATLEREARVLQATRAGTVDRSWVDKALRERGCAGV
ncbi:RraA family protein [Ramlibacter tataouinensis]|uniref:RraA family protein n=1 Tax=Ramlibacter tataouinensis TaxID=94132 RepID=UPI0022F40800|nr:RraA family protein [Ramlibacter tataouinensis]WBY01426.1 RraA family protein [Ramlibacter tataouinensis]